jgi:hypothetical protein
VSCVLGTKCLPVTFYLVPRCPTPDDGSGRAAFSSIDQSQFTAVPLRDSEQVPLSAELRTASIKVRPPVSSMPARAPAPGRVNAEVAMVHAK